VAGLIRAHRLTVYRGDAPIGSDRGQVLLEQRFREVDTLIGKVQHP
jgi:hypothetical protein